MRKGHIKGGGGGGGGGVDSAKTQQQSFVVQVQNQSLMVREKNGNTHGRIVERIVEKVKLCSGPQ